MESRVLAILEVFVSELYLTEDQAAALAHVWEGAGRQFDPKLVETLEALIEEEIKR
jgi:response regulator RpfG family c-di-GMP phosphodiesterase